MSNRNNYNILVSNWALKINCNTLIRHTHSQAKICVQLKSGTGPPHKKDCTGWSWGSPYFLPDRSRALWQILGFLTRQKLVEITIFHVFSNHAERVISDAHSQQPDYIGILQLGHNLNLLEEVVPARNKRQARVKLVSYVVLKKIKIHEMSEYSKALCTSYVCYFNIGH